MTNWSATWLQAQTRNQFDVFACIHFPTLLEVPPVGGSESFSGSRDEVHPRRAVGKLRGKNRPGASRVIIAREHGDRMVGVLFEELAQGPRLIARADDLAGQLEDGVGCDAAPQKNFAEQFLVRKLARLGHSRDDQ